MKDENSETAGVVTSGGFPSLIPHPSSFIRHPSSFKKKPLAPGIEFQVPVDETPVYDAETAALLFRLGFHFGFLGFRGGNLLAEHDAGGFPVLADLDRLTTHSLA